MKVYTAPDWDPKDSATERFFWPVVGLVGVGLFVSYALLVSPVKKQVKPNSSVNRPSPTIAPAVTAAPVVENQQFDPSVPQDQVTWLREAPAQPPAPPTELLNKMPNDAALRPAQQPAVGTYGPRGPPAVSGIAENGSQYGDTSTITGRPKTVEVRGYYRKDGTYVRGHYRSK